MKKRYKWQSILALSLLTTSVLAGCGNSNNKEAASSIAPSATSVPSSAAFSPAASPKVDTSKEVKLKMYLLGDKPKDFEEVYGEVNKLLKQDINATVDVSFLSWADWQQKYPLLFASGDDFDLIYTANWAQYNQQASKGGFLELTKDMLDQYMPKTAASMYPEAWEQAKIQGKVYMVPMNYKEMFGNFSLLRGDLLEKYGLKAEDMVKDSKSIEAYYEAFYKDTKIVPLQGGDKTWWGMPYYLPSEMMKNWFEVGSLSNFHVYYDTTQDSPKVFPFIDTDAFVKGVTVTKEWVDKGIISKSAAVNKSSDGFNDFLNGKAPAGGGNLATANSNYASVNAQHPEYKLVGLNANYGNPVAVNPFIQNGIAINRNSKNPERALMMLDLFRNDERYFNLTTYGIQGKHYDLSADGKSIVPLTDSAGFSPDGACPWGWRNDQFYKLIDGGMPDYQKFKDDMVNNAAYPKLTTFVFDDTNVKNQIAAVNNVLEQYEKPLVYGMIKSSIDSDVAKLRELIKKAGGDEVVAELQKQVDAFLAANK
ncbi:extracellular solute-binding protein [Gorillibacterium massiliense]|uniref:extracellular solute-binding protein n=1 Tax=Gorillibacterium massiliense TaxID=1280390 RepID=UPI0005949660|nr:extracellular solute-binding protein [Gorillibacterium massiliense]